MNPFAQMCIHTRAYSPHAPGSPPQTKSTASADATACGMRDEDLVLAAGARAIRADTLAYGAPGAAAPRNDASADTNPGMCVCTYVTDSNVVCVCVCTYTDGVSVCVCVCVCVYIHTYIHTHIHTY